MNKPSTSSPDTFPPSLYLLPPPFLSLIQPSLSPYVEACPGISFHCRYLHKPSPNYPKTSYLSPSPSLPPPPLPLPYPSRPLPSPPPPLSFYPLSSQQTVQSQMTPRLKTFWSPPSRARLSQAAPTFPAFIPSLQTPWQSRALPQPRLAAERQDFLKGFGWACQALVAQNL